MLPGLYESRSAVINFESSVLVGVSWLLVFLALCIYVRVDTDTDAKTEADVDIVKHGPLFEVNERIYRPCTHTHINKPPQVNGMRVL